MTRVKICGVTTAGDARQAALLGADVLGLNFVPASPRRLDSSMAARIVEAVPTGVSLTGVFADFGDPVALEDFALSLGLHAVQLHGSETPD